MHQDYTIILKVIGNKPERIELFIEGQAFLRSYDSAPRASSSPSLPSASCLSFTVLLCVSGREKGEEVGVEPNHATARKPGPLYIVKYLMLLNTARSNQIMSYIHCTTLYHPFSPSWADFTLMTELNKNGC